MLGIRLKPKEEELLARHARELGRPKSAVAREWIVQRLERETVDDLIRAAAKLHAEQDGEAARMQAIQASAAQLRRLDAEDGGYDWGPEGPPPTR